MSEKAKKNKSSAGKFFLGAAIGAAVGAIASKFIKLGPDGNDEKNICPQCEKTEKECKCDQTKVTRDTTKEPTKEVKKESKKETKKVADKK